MDVSLQIILLLLVGLTSADDLLFQHFDVRREKPVQVKLVSFFLRESRAFVQQWGVEQIYAARKNRLA